MMNDDRLTLDDLVNFVRRIIDVYKSYIKYYLIARLATLWAYIAFHIFEMVLLSVLVCFILAIFILLCASLFSSAIGTLVSAILIILAMFFMYKKYKNSWIEIYLDRKREKLFRRMIERKYHFRGCDYWSCKYPNLQKSKE